MYIFFFVFLGLLWAFSWLLFVGSALFAAALYLSVTAFRQIEYSIRGLCRYGITLWDLVQNSKSRWQLCALTGTGVAVTRILVWSAVAFAQRIHPNGAAEMVGLVVFPEVFLSSLYRSDVAVCSAFVLESVLVSLALWLSLGMARYVLRVAARLWPHLENKLRNGFLRWLQKA